MKSYNGKFIDILIRGIIYSYIFILFRGIIYNASYSIKVIMIIELTFCIYKYIFCKLQ